MRKYLGTALESYANNRIALEDEEMEVMAKDADQAEAEVVGQDMPEVDGIADKVDALEDLAVIADGIEEASPEELALIRNVSDMAVAGTDMGSEELISEEVVPLEVEVTGEAELSTEVGATGATLPQVSPEEVVIAQEAYKARKIATEAFVGKRISQEGIAEIKHAAKRAWEAILKFLKDIWVKIEKFFYNILGSVPLLRKRCEALKKRAQDIDNDGTLVKGKEKLDIVSGIDKLSEDYNPLTTGAAYKSAIAKLSDTTGNVAKYLGNVSGIGDGLADIIEKFDAKNPAATVNAIASKATGTGLDFPGTTSGTDSRWTDFTVNKTSDIIGNVVISIRRKKVESKDQLAVIESFKSLQVQLISIKDNDKSSKKEFSMEPLSTSEVISVVEAELKLLDELEKIDRGTKLKDLIKTKDKIMSAAKKAEGSFNKLKEGKNEEGGATERAVHTYRVAIDFARSYTQWTTLPMSYFKHCTSVVSAVNSVLAKSLSSFKKQKTD